VGGSAGVSVFVGWVGGKRLFGNGAERGSACSRWQSAASSSAAADSLPAACLAGYLARAAQARAPLFPGGEGGARAGRTGGLGHVQRHLAGGVRCGGVRRAEREERFENLPPAPRVGKGPPWDYEATGLREAAFARGNAPGASVCERTRHACPMPWQPPRVRCHGSRRVSDAMAAAANTARRRRARARARAGGGTHREPCGRAGGEVQRRVPVRVRVVRRARVRILPSKFPRAQPSRAARAALRAAPAAARACGRARGGSRASPRAAPGAAAARCGAVRCGAVRFGADLEQVHALGVPRSRGLKQRREPRRRAHARARARNSQEVRGNLHETARGGLVQRCAPRGV
jgi:hypothetical protein